MKRVSLNLEHCYGIKLLKAVLDFSKTQAYAIYAPNGVMKSSLAQTFQDAFKGETSKDRIFSKRATLCHITDERGFILLMFAQYSVKVRHAAPAPARHSLCSKVTLYSAGINKEVLPLSVPSR